MFKLLVLLTSFMSFGLIANEVRVLTEHLPPYQIAKNGQIVSGSSYLIMKEVLKRANIDAITEVAPWIRTYRTALSEPNTIIYSITRSKERELLFNWIGQLHHLEYSFFSKSDNKNIQIETGADVLNYTVVSVRGSFEASSLQRQGFKVGENLILVLDYITAWKMLKLDRADLTYGNEIVYVGGIADDTLFKRQGNVVEIFDLYVAANLNTDEKILKRLSSAFQSVKQDPSFKNLFKIKMHN